MSERKKGTSIRPLARVLDRIDRPTWLIDAEGRLAYLSAACQTWLGVDPEDLLGCATTLSHDGDTPSPSTAEAGLSATQRSGLATQLAAPLGLLENGQAHCRVTPISNGQKRPAQDVLFIALDEHATQVLAIAGHPLPGSQQADQQLAIQLENELKSWRQKLPPFSQLPITLGTSPSAGRLQRQLLLASASFEHLLFVGPSGCGSESMVRAIRQHRLQKLGNHSKPDSDVQRRADLDSPLIVVDGGLMDAELLEATLAPMTDRLRESPSSVATVVLRDLEQMPLVAQSRFDQICDLFSERLFIAALSRKSFPQLQEENQLTPSLAAKLGVFQIEVESLADRAADLPLIATAILQRRRSQGEGRAERFNRQAMEAILIYPWPRNFQELEETVRHAIRNCQGPAILLEHLPLAIRSYRPPDPSNPQSRLLHLDESLQKMERQLILKAIDQADGNRAEAARNLGISRGRLLRRLQEFEEAPES